MQTSINRLPTPVSEGFGATKFYKYVSKNTFKDRSTSSVFNPFIQMFGSIAS